MEALKWKDAIVHDCGVLCALGLMEDSKAYVTGHFEDEFKYDHEAYGNIYCSTILACRRKSGNIDYIPVMIKKEDVPACNVKGRKGAVMGSIRTVDKKRCLTRTYDVYLFAQEITVYAEDCEDEFQSDENRVYVRGYVCKTPIKKNRPGTKITLLIISVNRSKNRKNYLAVVTFGNKARVARKRNIGDQVELIGRFQSVDATKHDPETGKTVPYRKYNIVAATICPIISNSQNE